MDVARKLADYLTEQARTPEEIQEAVDLFSGDLAPKQSRFWLLLVLSTVVASAGVIGDSTATVIGAMIIAPLATPIQGVATAIAAGDMRALIRSAVLVLAASTLVVLLGAALGALLPQLEPLSQNPQVTGRVSPTIIELVAASAVGLAAAFAVARRDIGDILPGVAIAISLVPPLAVVGITAAAGEWGDALGALVLFATNVLAMIVLGAAVYAGLGLLRAREPRTHFKPVYAVLAVSSVVVIAALSVATIRLVEVQRWQEAAARVGSAWAREGGAELVKTRFDGDTLVLVVQGRGSAGRDSELPHLLHGAVPDGTPVAVDRVEGAVSRVGDVRAAATG